MNKIEQQKEHFNSIAKEYYYVSQSTTSLLYEELLWSYVVSYLPPSNKDVIKVLEPMCGMGKGEENIGKYHSNIDYIGFDYSEEMVNLAKEHKPNRTIFVQDATTFYPSEEYDVIIIGGGLHHVPDYVGTVLKNLYSGLRENGYFLSTEPTHGNMIAKAIRSRIYKTNANFDHTTERGFSVGELNELFETSGYKIMHQFYIGLIAYTLSSFKFLSKKSLINKRLLKILFTIEKPFYRTRLARFFSFATVSIFTKPSVMD